MENLDLNFTCGNCGAEKSIKLLSGVNRKTLYRVDCEVNVPNWFKLPTCTACREWYWTEEITKKLNPILLKQALLKQKKSLRILIEELKEATGYSARVIIVQGCGMQWSVFNTYFEGKEIIPLPLQRLLESFVKYPQLCLDYIQRKTE